MYNQVEEQAPLNIQQQIIIKQKVYTIEQAEKAISHLSIPDEVEFTHKYEFSTPCICGKKIERSYFHIDGIGRLELGYQEQVCCCTGCCKSYQKSCSCMCSCFECNDHSFPEPNYWIENENIRMEFWSGGIGRIMAGGQTVMDFTQSIPNDCDRLYAHCHSGFPQLSISRTQDTIMRPFVLTPETSPLPEDCCGCMYCLCLISCFGVFKTTRNFFVDGLTQGRCVIINRRNCCEALAKISLCQGSLCCCPEVDYPSYSVSFENVQNMDKVAILMGLVHTAIYKKWYTFNNIRVKLSDFVGLK